MLTPETIDIQNRLASYCRTGEPVEIPGVKAKHLHHYRRLVNNVVHSTMKQAFPITYKILKQEEWENMVNRFFREHDAQTPKIWELPGEFYEYVRSSGYAEKYDRSYLNDLLCFEWAEIEVHSMPDMNPDGFETQGDPFTETVVLNYESRIIRLEYPVHRLAAEASRNKKGNYFVLVLREPETGYVRFIDLSILHVYLIEHIHTEKKPVAEMIDELASAFRINDKALLNENLRKFMNDLYAQKAILGFGGEFNRLTGSQEKRSGFHHSPCSASYGAWHVRR